MKFIKGFTVLLTSILMATTAVAADGGQYKEILERADEARGNLEGVEWVVSILSVENGRENTRVLKIKAKGYDFLATLTAPPKVKHQKLLMVDRNMWFAKPGLRKPVPISSRQRLVGGISYGDIASTNYAKDYSAEMLPDQMLAGELCSVFELKANTKKATYDQVKYWISKDRGLGIAAQYYTISGKLLKSATFEYDNVVRYDGKDHPFISKMVITDGVIPENIGTLIFSEPKLKRISDATLDVNLLMSR